MSTGRILAVKLRRDLRARAAQVAAVAITVFIGVTLFVGNLDAARNLRASYEELYERLSFADVWATGGPTDEVAATVAGMPGVTAVEVRTQADLPLTLGGRELRGRLVGLTDGGRAGLNQLFVMEGALPAEPDEVALDHHGAAEFDLGPGDRVRVGEAELTVTAVVSSPEYLWLARSADDQFSAPSEFAVVFADEAVAAVLAPEAPRQVVAAVDGDDPSRLADIVSAALDAGAADVYDQPTQPSNDALQADVTGFEQLSYLFPLLFLTVAGMATYVVLGRMIRLQRPQIGMMLANGMATRQIFRHYVGYGIAAAALGALPALLAGAVLGRWISRLYTDFLDIPITVGRTWPASIVGGTAFALLMGVVAGGVPARAAARIRPAAAMRPVSPTGRAEPTLLERLVPFRLPTGAVLVVRNATRQRRRTATTAIGVMLAVVLLIVSFGLRDSTLLLVDRQFEEIDRRDLSVLLDRPVSDAELSDLAADGRVAVAERFAELPVVLDAGDGPVTQLLHVFEAGTDLHGFETPLPANGLVLSEAVAGELDVDEGDVVGVTAPDVGLRVDATVAGLVDEPLIGVSYASVEAWEAIGGPAPSTAVLGLVDEADAEAVRDELSARGEVLAITNHRAAVDALRDLLGLFDLFVGLMIAFSMVLAIALVFNAISVALAERTGEVATLVANGVPWPFMRRTITAENLLVVLFGLLPGLVLGRIVGAAFLGQFTTESFTFDFSLTARSLVWSVVLVVGGAVFAQLPGLRALRRLDLPAAVRERSA